MKAELKVYENPECDTETLIRYENKVGNALVGASIIEVPDQGAGNALPDEFKLAFRFDDEVIACDVTCKDGRKYTKKFVEPNSVNEDHIIPGAKLVIGDLTGDYYESMVYIGWNPGVIVAGKTSDAKRMFVKNIGDNGYDARIRILPDGEFENIVGEPVRAISETKYLQKTPVGKFNVKIKADTTRIDVRYEGSDPCEVEIGDGEGEYEIATGIWVTFNGNLFTDDEANINISDGYNRVQIAPDLNGTPGEFGTDDVIFGNMREDDVDSFWVRIQTQPGDLPFGNLRHANLQARITTY